MLELFFSSRMKCFEIRKNKKIFFIINNLWFFQKKIKMNPCTWCTKEIGAGEESIIHMKTINEDVTFRLHEKCFVNHCIPKLETSYVCGYCKKSVIKEQIVKYIESEDPYNNYPSHWCNEQCYEKYMEKYIEALNAPKIDFE